MSFPSDPLLQTVLSKLNKIRNNDLTVTNIASYTNATAVFSTIADLDSGADNGPYIHIPYAFLGRYTGNGGAVKFRLTLYDYSDTQQYQQELSVPSGAGNNVYLDSMGDLQSTTGTPSNVMVDLKAKRILLEGHDDAATSIDGDDSNIFSYQIFR